MKISKLQVIIIAIALAAALVAVLIFSGILPGLGTFRSSAPKKITLWGTVPEEVLFQSLADLKRQPYNIETLYVRKDPANFENELINALAREAGPDVIIFPSEFILKHRDKLEPLPLEVLNERIFKDTFADGAELLIRPEGILGLPFLVDPVMLYWNRDLFKNKSISAPPKTWDEFLSSAQSLTEIDGSGNIVKSGAALGVETNVRHFKEILSLLILQTGAPIIDAKTLKASFRESGAEASGPDAVEMALRFYAEFSNPQKASYSWSRVLPPSRDAFTRELLAIYFGFGSEFSQIRQLNPHLNFDIASVPQIKGGKLNLTYGKFWSLGITKQSQDLASSLEAIKFLINKDQLNKISKGLGLAPSRRDLLSERIENPVLTAIFREAVKFKSWLDADYAKTSEIFGQMIKSVYTGAKSENQASRDAKLQLDSLYNPQ